MIDLAWPITVLIMFFGCLWFAVKRSQFKQTLATLKIELTELKSKQAQTDTQVGLITSEMETLQTDINNLKVSRGFTTRG